jgi:hypothetical protein
MKAISRIWARVLAESRDFFMLFETYLQHIT